MKYILDRFESDMAILEGDDKKALEVLRSTLPPQAKEGDCLTLLKDGSYAIDENATASRKKNIDKLIDGLFV